MFQIIISEDVVDVMGNPVSNPITEADNICFFVGDPAGADDFEPDDDFASATLIELDNMYTGTIHSDSDTDFFKIALNDTKNYDITLGNIPDGCSYDIKVYFASNYDSKLTNLIEYQSDGKKYLILPTISGEHTYYIQVFTEGGYSSTGLYSLILIEKVLDTGIYFNDAYANADNNESVSMKITGANETDTYNFDILSNGSTNGALFLQHFTGTVGSGSFSLDLSSLYDGVLTISNFTLTDEGNHTSTPVAGENYTVKDTIIPSIYSASFSTNPVNCTNHTSVQISFSGRIASDEYSFDIISDGGGIKQLTGSYDTGSLTVDLSDLSDGTLSIDNLILTDLAGNVGSAESGSNTALKDTVIPINGSWTASGPISAGANLTTTFSKPMDESTVESTSNYTINYTYGSSGVSITTVDYNFGTQTAIFTISYSSENGQIYTISPLVNLWANPLWKTQPTIQYNIYLDHPGLA